MRMRKYRRRYRNPSTATKKKPSKTKNKNKNKIINKNTIHITGGGSGGHTTPIIPAQSNPIYIPQLIPQSNPVLLPNSQTNNQIEELKRDLIREKTALMEEIKKVRTPVLKKRVLFSPHTKAQEAFEKAPQEPMFNFDDVSSVGETSGGEAPPPRRGRGRPKGSRDTQPRRLRLRKTEENDDDEGYILK